MQHEMRWDNGSVYCRCGWISDDSPHEVLQMRRRDQQKQFLDHLKKVRAEEGVQLNDSNQ